MRAAISNSQFIPRSLLSINPVESGLLFYQMPRLGDIFEITESDKCLPVEDCHVFSVVAWITEINS